MEGQTSEDYLTRRYRNALLAMRVGDCARRVWSLVHIRENSGAIRPEARRSNLFESERSESGGALGDRSHGATGSGGNQAEAPGRLADSLARGCGGGEKAAEERGKRAPRLDLSYLNWFASSCG